MNPGVDSQSITSGITKGSSGINKTPLHGGKIKTSPWLLYIQNKSPAGNANTKSVSTERSIGLQCCTYNLGENLSGLTVGKGRIFKPCDFEILNDYRLYLCRISPLHFRWERLVSEPKLSKVHREGKETLLNISILLGSPKGSDFQENHAEGSSEGGLVSVRGALRDVSLLCYPLAN